MEFHAGPFLFLIREALALPGLTGFARDWLTIRTTTSAPAFAGGAQ